MNNLGRYYEQIEKNYDLMKKYYLQAIEKGYSDAMNSLGLYYFEIEKNYDPAKKYFSMAIDNGNIHALCNIGLYYEIVVKNYNMMECYYWQATEKGNHTALKNLDLYYLKKNPSYSSLQNYVYATIKGHFVFIDVELFSSKEKNLENNLIIFFCGIIDHEKLMFDNFKYCVKRITTYLNSNNKYVTLDYLEHFMKYIGRLYYGKSKKNKEHKEYLTKELNLEKSMPQIFMILLKKYYDKYIEEKYAPGGSGYIKTKKHFESIVTKKERNNDLCNNDLCNNDLCNNDLCNNGKINKCENKTNTNNTSNTHTIM
jgi:hypothetical protein